MSAKDAYAAALLRERDAMATHSKTDRVAAIDAELARIGVPVPGKADKAASDAPKPVKRTTTRKA